jgi:hypothetical protein
MQQSDDLNRRSDDTGGPLGVLKRTLRIVPVFAVAATATCLVGYYAFHIPPEQLGTVAAVPCVLGFIVIRLIAVLLPAQSADSEYSPPSAFFRIVVLLSVVAALVAIDFLCSASVYYGLREPKWLILGAFRIAGLSASAAVGFILIALFSRVPELWVAVFASAVKVLRTQTELTRALFVPPSHKHWSR